MNQVIELQEQFRRALPMVRGCKDYRQEQELLEQVDQVLSRSGLESRFMALSRARFEREAGEPAQDGARALDRQARHSTRALRCTVLKALLGKATEMSARLAHSPLYRWFGRCEDFAIIQVPGKSTMNDYAHWLPVAQMEEVLDTLTRVIRDEEHARLIGLASELDVAVAWVDTRCVEANVHFPTDWVLLRDGVRTIIRSVETIRRHGLRRRMPKG